VETAAVSVSRQQFAARTAAGLDSSYSLPSCHPAFQGANAQLSMVSLVTRK
jgi:hypothetical protein